MQLFPKSSDDRSQFYKLLVIIIILIFIIGIRNVLLPNIFEMTNAFTGYTNVNNRLEKVANWKEKRNRLTRSIKKLNADLLNTNLVLPADNQTSFVFDKMDSIANDSKIKIIEFKIGKKTDKDPFLITRGEIEIKGRFSNISKFIKEVETQAMLINIVSFRIKTESLYAKSISAIITVDMYFEKS